MTSDQSFFLCVMMDTILGIAPNEQVTTRFVVFVLFSKYIVLCSAQYSKVGYCQTFAIATCRYTEDRIIQLSVISTGFPSF